MPHTIHFLYLRYLDGFRSHYADLEASLAACDAAPKCAGVTFEPSTMAYTLRASSRLFRSSVAEISWVRTNPQSAVAPPILSAEPASNREELAQLALRVGQCLGITSHEAIIEAQASATDPMRVLMAAAGRCASAYETCGPSARAWGFHNLALATLRSCGASAASAELTRRLFNLAIDAAPDNGRIWLHFASFESSQGAAQKVGAFTNTHTKLSILAF